MEMTCGNMSGNMFEDAHTHAIQIRVSFPCSSQLLDIFRGKDSDSRFTQSSSPFLVRSNVDPRRGFSSFNFPLRSHSLPETHCSPPCFQLSLFFFVPYLIVRERVVHPRFHFCVTRIRIRFPCIRILSFFPLSFLFPSPSSQPYLFIPP